MIQCRLILSKFLCVGERFRSLDRMPAFAGADETVGRQRTAPVEFEKDVDPFGLESLMESSKKQRRT